MKRSKPEPPAIYLTEDECAVEFTIITRIKRAHTETDHEARQRFQALVSKGEIVFSHNVGLNKNLPCYKMK